MTELRGLWVLGFQVPLSENPEAPEAVHVYQAETLEPKPPEVILVTLDGPDA